MRKIMWLSNCQFTEEKMRTTGTWLYAMMEALLKSNEVKLYNVTQGNVKEFTRNDFKTVSQWIIPREKANRKGLPSRKAVDFIRNLEAEINPDLVHIWGTESFWGMLGAKGILSKPVLLDMQGILYAYAKVFYGGLTNREILRCIGLKEILLPKRFLYFRQQEFKKRGVHELYTIKNTRFISVQSDWVKAHITLENPTCAIFDTGIILRKEFYQAAPWIFKNNIDPVIFTSSSGSTSYKGLHVLFRALAVLKQQFPTIRLKIAGTIQQRKFLQDGYTEWLIKEAKKLGVLDQIEWLGALDADEIVKQFQSVSAVVVPSFAETYCLAFAEAMMVGVPSVVSYAGAMPELGKHDESALFFPVGDYMSCAWQINRILNDKVLSEKLSQNARAVGLIRNNPDKVANQQLKIYNSVIER